MDRDELQERIRARRTGGDPYRRGGAVDEGPGYERFEPDPNDVRVRRGRQIDDRRPDLFEEPVGGAGGGGAERPPDITRDRDEWARPAAAPTAAAAPPPTPFAPPPSDVPVAAEAPEPARPYAGPAAQPAYEEQPAYVDNFDDASYERDDDYRYEYDEWDERRERRSGAGAFAILGFLALGVLALLGGALLAGVFSGEPNTGAAPSATPSQSAAGATAEATPSATPAAAESGAASGSPAASGDPIVFPDGFSAEAQPCVPGSAGGNGCDSNGVNNGGAVDIWVGFTNGNSSDLIGARLVAPDGTTRDGSIDLARIGCTSSCNGWTYFPFSNLSPGTYEVQITRNGEPAGTTTFEVS